MPRAELPDRLALARDLAEQAAPGGPRADARRGLEQKPVHTPQQQRLAGERHPAQLRDVAGGAVLLAQHLRGAPHVLRTESQRHVVLEPPRRGSHVLEQQLAVPIGGLTGEVAERVQAREHVVGDSVAHRTGHGAFTAHVATGKRAQHAEVEERHVTVFAQQIIPGMGIAEREAELERRAVVEAIDDLGVAVTDLVGLAADIVEAEPVDPVGDEHPPVAERRVNRRDENERMAPPEPGDLSVIGRLELVVAFLDDPLAQLGEDVFDVESRHELPQHRREQRQVAHVGFDRVGDAGVLDLDGDLAAVVGHASVHLPDAGGGSRLGIDPLEHAVGILAPLSRQDLAHLRPLDGAHAVTQRGETFLDVGRLVLVETGDLDRREHLAGLHRGATQDRELVDERIDGGDDPVAAAPAPVIVAPVCVQTVADPSGGATHGHAAESGGSRGPRTAGDAVISGRHCLNEV